MPKVTVSIPHQQPVEEAKTKIQPAIQTVLEAFNATDVMVNWTGDDAVFQCKSMGFSIKGTGKVEANKVEITVDLPFAALMFKDRVEKSLTKHLTRALSDRDGT